MNNIEIQSKSRSGSEDIWNAFMVRHTIFSKNDIPISSTTDQMPRNLIAFDQAKTIFNRTIHKDPSFFVDAFIHFYIDDQKFDGKQSSIWSHPDKALNIIKHFAGVISPDFSTFQDFPMPIKIYNIYRMRAFDCWMDHENISYIHNVRWGTKESWGYCFDGIPQGSIIGIGTVACNLRNVDNRSLFEDGFKVMVDALSPKGIVIYGSERSHVIADAKQRGIKVITFPSKTSLAYRERVSHE